MGGEAEGTPENEPVTESLLPGRIEDKKRGLVWFSGARHLGGGRKDGEEGGKFSLE